jgi:hypothetical protein
LQKSSVIAKLEIFGVQTIPILCTWGLNFLSFCSFPTFDCSNVAFFKQHMNSIIYELLNVCLFFLLTLIFSFLCDYQTLQLPNLVENVKGRKRIGKYEYSMQFGAWLVDVMQVLGRKLLNS